MKEEFKTKIKAFNKRDFLTWEELKEFVVNNGTDGVYYVYSLLGVLSDFRITGKGLSSVDSIGNRVYFNANTNSKYSFFKSGLYVSE